MNAHNNDSLMLQQITDLLTRTTEIPHYLDLLKVLRAEYMIVLSVKDTPGNKTPASIIQKIHEIGFSRFDTKLWLMYSGIMYHSAVLLDKSGEKPELPIHYECDINGCHVDIGSESYKSGNRASIIIDGTDYALNRRGVNIVVYDTVNHSLVDSISFDCHDNPSGVFFRKGQEPITCSKTEFENAIAQINRRLDSLVRSEALHDAQNKHMLWQAIAEKGEAITETKKRFFMSMPKAEGTLRNMQLAGAILLTKLDEVCRANDLPYWISFGTLLGAVRHKGFIPWDDDTDVCMMRSDAEKLTKIMENDTDFYVSHIFAEYDDNLNHCVQLKYRKSGTPYCLDIFIYDYCSDISPENIKRQTALNAELAKEAQPIRKSGLDTNQKKEKYYELLNKYLDISRKTVGITDEPSKYMIWALDNFGGREFLQGNCAVSDVFPLRSLMFEGKELMAPCNPEKYLKDKYGDIYSLPSDMLSHVHFRLDAHQEAVLNEILEKYLDTYLKNYR